MDGIKSSQKIGSAFFLLLQSNAALEKREHYKILDFIQGLQVMGVLLSPIIAGIPIGGNYCWKQRPELFQVHPLWHMEP